MKTCEHDGEPFTEPRSHPWTDSAVCSDYRYYDLKAWPSHIRTSLEDFLPWSHYPAVEQFYSLLEWLNESASALESNDCAFTGPQANETPEIARPLQCSGRVMVLYRTLTHNLSRERVEWLKNALHHRLQSLDSQFQWGVIGTTILPVRYLTLAVDADRQLGYQLMLSFWAWGRSERDVMTNLCRLVKNLSRALREVSAKILAG